MVQLLIFLKNLKVLFAARKEGTRNHCLKKCFVQQVSKTFIPGVFVSGSAQLFPCFEVICDICCRNLHQCVQLVCTWAHQHSSGLLLRWESGSEGFTAFCKFMAWKWTCTFNSTTCWPAGSVRMLLQTLQWVRESVTSPEISSDRADSHEPIPQTPGLMTILRFSVLTFRYQTFLYISHM